MHKRNAFFVATLTFAVSVTSVFYAIEGSLTAKAENISNTTVYVGGMPAGFTLSTGGVQIVGICEVMSESGVKSPAQDACLKPGDVIKRINGIRISSIEELNEILLKNGDKKLLLEVERGKCSFSTFIEPQKDKVTGRYKIGVLIRDTISGIGTVSFIDPQTMRFGALGHAVTDEENRTLSIANGYVYTCSIIGASKGMRGKAGELHGLFSETVFGKADTVTLTGIYGTIDSNLDMSSYLSAKTVSVSEAKIGKAYIYTSVEGCLPCEYEIEIVKVDCSQKDNKNYVLHVTDRDLLEKTGGIVQGMSGSPILQNGSIIGAVTHVFLNDPTRGYGIDINTMILEERRQNKG